MNLKQAFYIRTIAEEGGITAAARKLYVSQPSLSQMLRLVEEELGVELFDRSRVPFRPTYAGERYLHAANVLLNTLRMLENELQEIREESRGRLRLGISMQRAAHLLPKVLPRFSREYPYVTLELQEAGSARLERMVQNGDVDMALATTSPRAIDLEYQFIQREIVGILAGWESALARTLPAGTPITLKRVQDGPFISLKAGHNLRVIQDALFREEGLCPAIYLETDSMEVARQVALTSAGYMLCSDIQIAPGSLFYPLQEYESQRHFYACYRQGQTLPRYAQDFLRMVRETVARESLNASDGVS